MSNFLFFRITFSILLSLAYISMSAQFIYISPNDQDIIAERLFENKKYLIQNPIETRSDDYLFVPINISIFSNSDSPSKINFEHILNLLCDLNNYYGESQIRFFLKNMPEYLINPTISHNPLSPMSVVELTKIKDNNALNIFVTTSSTLSSQFHNILAYYSPINDWVVMQEDEILIGKSHFLAHEIGHYFSLLHTFNGWESNPFNISTSGNKAGIISPDGITLTEHMSRNNCDLEGDYICDTNPDYNFGLGWIKNGDTCHDFDALVLDPDNKVVETNEQNIMGYFLGCKDYYFSPLQIQIMEIDYNSSRRNSIRSHTVLKQRIISKSPLLNKPTDNDRILERNPLFEWEAIEGATYYYLIIESVSQQNKIVIERIVNTNYYQSEDIINGNYTWKVKPLNATYTCSDFSSSSKFSVDNSLSISSEQNNKVQMALIPNLLGTNSDQTTLYISNNESIDVNVELYDVNGRRLKSFFQNSKIPSGNNNLVLPLSEELSSGMYFIKVHANTFQGTLKLIVQ